MYKKQKSEKPNCHKYITIKTNLKTYNTILKRSIRLAKIKLFYHSHFAKYKNDAQKTWSLINSIYYIKLQFSLSVYLSVCLSVCLSVPPPLLSTRPSDRNQIWHTYSGRYGTHSQLKKIDPPHPRGNITSFVTSSNVEHVRHLWCVRVWSYIP